MQLFVTNETPTPATDNTAFIIAQNLARAAAAKANATLSYQKEIANYNSAWLASGGSLKQPRPQVPLVESYDAAGQYLGEVPACAEVPLPALPPKNTAPNQYKSDAPDPVMARFDRLESMIQAMADGLEALILKGKA